MSWVGTVNARLLNHAAAQRFIRVKPTIPGGPPGYMFMSPGKNHNLGSKSPSRLRRLSASEQVPYKAPNKYESLWALCGDRPS